MDYGSRGLEPARQSTARICDSAGRHVGQGLSLEVDGAGIVILTCHHVVAEIDEIHVAITGADGLLGTPVPAAYDVALSRPQRDAAVLHVNLTKAGPNPYLQSLDPARYSGHLSVVAFTHVAPGSFDAALGPATRLELPVPKPGPWPEPPARYQIPWAFRLAQPTDARQGISGGVVLCEDGVIGLVHFARAEGPQLAREAYAVPLRAWAEDWPALAKLIHPLVDRKLRSAATVETLNEVRVGLGGAFPIDRFRPDLYLERGVAQTAKRRLREGRPVVVLVGKPKSGKTRLAWELAKDHPESLLLIPRSDDPPAEFEGAGLVGSRVLIFIDDWAAVPQRDVIEWRRRIDDATGLRSPVICTSRDGREWTELRRGRGRSLIQEAEVLFLSASDDGGSDLSREEGLRLADSLGLDESVFDEQFDGTPGSLVLDLAEMAVRYERLREIARGAVSCSRLLDSAKLAHVGGQPAFRLDILRGIAEQIRGEGPLSNETWEYLLDQTVSEGFGALDSSRTAFVTYRPYLEECVSYRPATAELERFLKILEDASDWTGLAHLADSLEERHSSMTEAACRKAIDGGAWAAYRTLGNALGEQPGRENEAAAAYRLGIEKGEMSARWGLGSLFETGLGQPEEAANVWTEIITEGVEPDASLAAGNLGALLADIPGREKEAESSMDRAIKGGVGVLVYFNLGNLLARQPGREHEAEQAFRDLVEAGDRELGNWGLGRLLGGQPGRTKEAETALTAAVDRGLDLALTDLATLVGRQAGRSAEAESFYRRAIVAGIGGASRGLGELLLEDPARASEAEQLLRAAIDAGDASAYAPLGQLLADQPDRQAEAETADRQAIEAGDPMGYLNLGFLLEDRPDSAAEAEEAFRAAIDAGLPPALVALGVLLAQQPGREREAEEASRTAIDAGFPGGYFALGLVFEGRPGREDDAENLYRQALDGGFIAAKLSLGRLLASREGRQREGCELLREVQAAGDEEAVGLIAELCADAR